MSGRSSAGGLIAQSTDLDSRRARAMTVYAGLDLTALKFRMPENIGHIVLPAGATGMIGDPRDVGERSLKRPVEWAETAGSWSVCRPRRLTIKLWNGPAHYRLSEFLRDIGKHFGQRLVRDTIQASGGGGISTLNSATVVAGQRLCRIAPAPRPHAGDRQADQWGNIAAGAIRCAVARVPLRMRLRPPDRCRRHCWQRQNGAIRSRALRSGEHPSAGGHWLLRCGKPRSPNQIANRAAELRDLLVAAWPGLGQERGAGAMIHEGGGVGQQHSG